MDDNSVTMLFMCNIITTTMIIINVFSESRAIINNITGSDCYIKNVKTLKKFGIFAYKTFKNELSPNSDGDLTCDISSKNKIE